MKAYVVTNEWDEGEAVVCFADHNIVARRNGANELNCEFGDVSCRRARHFDEFAPAGEVPKEALLQAGWWITCAHCGNQVSLDGADRDGNPLDPKFERDRVYCNQACVDGYDAEREAARQRDLDARRQVAEKFPGSTLVHISSNSFHPKRRNELVARVTFTFPGGQHPVEWYVGDETISVSKSDEQAYFAYREARITAHLGAEQ